MLWFAWKFVPLWYQQQRKINITIVASSCDLLENSYLCGISNNEKRGNLCLLFVVICLKIRTFVVSATTLQCKDKKVFWLWFAWKFVPLWYQQQLDTNLRASERSCDLLENSYLCGISNNLSSFCWWCHWVVICLKIRTFVVSATTVVALYSFHIQLWFAWKFVPLWYQQQPIPLLW